MKDYISIIAEVNKAIDAIDYNRKPGTLYEPIKYVLNIGGKRIRPVLMLLAYNMFKDDPERVMSQAVGIETYHNYTLLHDDLMDKADMRRGRLTVHKRWNANTAILSGDSMLVLATRAVAACDDKHLKKIIDLFTETALEIGEGQQYDMDFEKRDDVTEDEYIEMIRLKTSVLLACAMKMGAILADAPESDSENLYKYGEKIGLAFQLQDDYLDVYGDPKEFGKEIGGDIMSNKKTYMLINAFIRANDSQRKELAYFCGKTDFNRREKVDAVTRIYDSIGIDRLVQEKISFFFNDSRRYLDRLSVGDERKEQIIAFTNEMMRRKK